MKHATPTALEQLEDLLASLRRLHGLREKARGVFYIRSKAFLHFHEDPQGLFGDVRLSEDWERFAMNSAADRSRFLARVKDYLEPFC